MGTVRINIDAARIDHHQQSSFNLQLALVPSLTSSRSRDRFAVKAVNGERLNALAEQVTSKMGRIDVEQAIEELTLGEKVALTAGMLLELPSDDPRRLNCHQPDQG